MHVDGNDRDDLAGMLSVSVECAGTRPTAQNKCPLSPNLMEITFADSVPDAGSRASHWILRCASLCFSGSTFFVYNL